MTRFSVLFFFACAGSVVAQGTQRCEVGSQSWLDIEAWNTRELPDDEDSVFVPGWVGDSNCRIRPGSETVAGALLIGNRTGANGTVELIQGILRLDKTTIEGVVDAGQIILGRDGGVGKFVHSGGLVSPGRSVFIGVGENSTGEYIINGGVLQVGGGIVVAADSATGVLEINGSNCAVQAVNLIHGTAGTLRMTADNVGFSKIIVHNTVTLSGAMRLDATRLTTLPEEIVLIENRSANAIQGGFSTNTLINAPGYEIGYDGGSGNDVVLRRIVETYDSFEEWQAEFLPDTPPGREPLYRDTDSDGVVDIAEYKLGGDPTEVDSWQSKPVKSQGLWRYRYSELKSRNDVMLVPQVFRNGLWRSDLLKLEVIEETDETRLMEVSFKGAERSVRLHAELMPDPEKPMNVMLIMVDDLNDWVGCLGGHPQASTPHIDRLASRGVLFTNAHAPAPACNPSRTAMLTGMHPGRTGIYRNDVYYRDSEVLKDVVTMPEHFRANGYNTGYAGKVFHRTSADIEWDAPGPQRAIGDRVNNPNPPKTGRHRQYLDWSGIETTDDSFFDHKVATWGINRLDNLPADQPHFTAIGFYLPHLPWYAPKRFFERLSIDEITLPQIRPDDIADVPAFALEDTVSPEDDIEITALDLQKDAVHGYLSGMSFLDEQVGRVLTKLDTLPSLRNTIIVFVSDHGTHLGEKGHWRKGTLWRRSSHVPMIVVAPGLTKPGSQVNMPVSLLDLYPTLTELTSTEAPPQLMGQSLRGELADTRSAENRKVLITRRPKQRVLEDSRWRFIYYRPGVEELYDLRNDPNEWVNLGDDPAYKRIRRNFRRRLPRGNLKQVLGP